MTGRAPPDPETTKSKSSATKSKPGATKTKLFRNKIQARRNENKIGFPSTTIVLSTA
jgi:hypothetical protein